MARCIAFEKFLYNLNIVNNTQNRIRCVLCRKKLTTFDSTLERSSMDLQNPKPLKLRHIEAEKLNCQSYLYVYFNYVDSSLISTSNTL